LTLSRSAEAPSRLEWWRDFASAQETIRILMNYG